ncbi:MAG TPA: hypothetical protein VGL10_10195 [Gammaproteobacteria bacterium]
MKKLLWLVLFSTLHTTASAAGIGVSLNGDEETLYFPIKTGTLILEPFVSYDKTSGDLYGEGKFQALGLGILSTSPIAENVSMYVGLRFSIETTEVEDFGDQLEFEDQIFAPTLGAEYSPIANFSIGIEHRINFVSSELTVDGFSGSIDGDRTFSETLAIARIFFN